MSKRWPKRPQNHWNLDAYSTWSTDEKSENQELRIYKASSPSPPAKRSLSSETSPYARRIANRQKARRNKLVTIAKKITAIKNLASVLEELANETTLLESTSSSEEVLTQELSQISSPRSTSGIGDLYSTASQTKRVREIGNATSECYGEEQEQEKRVKYSTPTNPKMSTCIPETPGLMVTKDKK